MPDERSKAAHDAHADARNEAAMREKAERAAMEMVDTLGVHEERAREDGKARAVKPLVQEPLPRAFATPIPQRYGWDVSDEHLDVPGDEDVDGFGKGYVV